MTTEISLSMVLSGWEEMAWAALGPKLWDNNDKYTIFDKNDMKHLAGLIGQYRAMFKTVAGVENMNYNHVQSGNMLFLLRAFFDKMIVNGVYGSQDWINENYLKTNFPWDDNALKVLEFMLEEVEAKQNEITQKITIVYYLGLGGGASIFHAFDGEEVQTSHIGLVAALDYRTGFRLQQNPSAGVHGEKIQQIISSVKQVRALGSEVGEDTSITLASLGYKKQNFIDDIFKFANLLVQGKVVGQSNGDDGTVEWTYSVVQDISKLVEGSMLNSGDYALHILEWAMSDPLVGKWGIRQETQQLSDEKINNLSNEEMQQIIDSFIVLSRLPGQQTFTAGGASYMRWLYKNKIVEVSEYDNDGNPKLDNNGNPVTKQESIGDATKFTLRATSATSTPNKDKSEVRVKVYTDTILAVNYYAGQDIQRSSQKSNETDIESFKEYNRLVAEVAEKQKEKLNGEYWAPQEQGIPSKITTMQQMQNFITSAFNQAQNLMGLASDENYLGYFNIVEVVDNIWIRLGHILQNTKSKGTPAEIQQSQFDYGLLNKNAKTDLQLYNEAVGSASIITAYFFFYYSAIIEFFAARKQLVGIDLRKLKDSGITADDIINKAADADTEAANRTAGEAANEDEEVELTEEQLEKLQVFLRQCALLLNMDDLKEAYQKEFTKQKNPNTYNGLIHTIDCNDSDTRSNLITKLTASPTEKIESFLRITPDVQAALVPKLRFFKVFNTNDELKEIEISFPRHYDPNNTSYRLDNSDRVFRGGGSGIKSFSFSFEGTTPATARNDIQAELVLFFQDFQDLVKKRSGDDLFSSDGKGEKFSYIELMLLPGTRLGGAPRKDKYEDHFNSFDPSEHRIRVDVGWALRDDQMFLKMLEERNFLQEVKAVEKGKPPTKINLIKQALDTINKSYYLNMVDHDLDFKDDGSIEIKINYRAYFESITKTTNLDALLTPALAKEKIVLGAEYQAILTDKELCKNPQEFEELMNLYQAIEARYVRKSHQSIIQRLIKRNKLHYCMINKEDMENYRKFGYFAQAPKLHFSSTLDTISNDVDADVAIETVADDEDPNAAVEVDVFHDSELLNLGNLELGPVNEEEFTTFFYFGDLVHVVLDCLKDPFDPDGRILPHLKKNKIILSSFNYLDSKNQLRNINLSEVPISTEYFFEWMNQNVTKPKRKSYPLTYFIRDLCNKLIVDLLLEQCINRNPVKTLSFKTLNILGKSADDPFEAMDVIENTNHRDVTTAYNEGLLPLESNIGEGSINDVYNYIALYPVTEILAHEGTGDYVEDGKNGIYHFIIGQNDGIVKTIKFAKTDIQYIREARFMNHGHDGLMQLSAVYKVTLEMFGNTIFYPGMYIYIDPRGIGGKDFDPTNFGSIANSLGIGGYHLITRVNSNVGPGSFNTTVEAQFVYSGDGKEGPFKRSYKEVKPVSVSAAPFAGRSVDNACTKITLYRQGSLENIGESENESINLAAAESAGVLDDVVNGTFVNIENIDLLTTEDFNSAIEYSNYNAEYKKLKAENEAAQAAQEAQEASVGSGVIDAGSYVDEEDHHVEED